MLGTYGTVLQVIEASLLEEQSVGCELGIPDPGVFEDL